VGWNNETAEFSPDIRNLFYDGRLLSVLKMERLSDIRERILEAAIKAISERGCTQTTTILTAKEAQVFQGMIFHYFTNKRNLFLAAAAEISRRFAERVKTSTSGEKDPLQKIKQVALAAYAMPEELTGLFDIVLSYVKSSGLDTEEMSRTGVLRATESFVRIVKEGIEQGIIREIEPYTAAAIFFGIMNHTIIRWLGSKRSYSLRESMAVAANLFIRGIKAA